MKYTKHGGYPLNGLRRLLTIIFLLAIPSLLTAEITITSLPYEITESNQTYRVVSNLSSSTNGIKFGDHVDNVILDLGGNTLTFGTDGGDDNYGIGIYWNPTNITVKNGWVIHNTGGNTDAADNVCIYVGNADTVLVKDVSAIIDGVDGKCFRNNGSAHRIEISGGVYKSNSTKFSSRCTTTGSVISYMPQSYINGPDDYHIKIHDIQIIDGPHTGISILHSDMQAKVDIYNNFISTDAVNEMYPEYDGNTCHSSGNAYGISIYGLAPGSKIHNNTIRSGDQREGNQGILLQDCKGSADNPVEVYENDILVSNGPDRSHPTGKVSALYWRYVPGESGTWNRFNHIHDNIFRVLIDTDTNTTCIGRMAEAVSVFFQDSCDNNIFEKNHVEVLTGTVDGFIEVAAIGFGIEDTLIAGFEGIKNNVWRYNYYKAPKNPVAFGNSRGHPGNNITLFKDTINCLHTGSDSTTIVFDQTGAYLNHSTGNRLRDCVFLNQANDNDIIFPFQAYSDADGLGHDVRYERTLNIYIKGNNNLPVTGAQVTVVNNYGQTVISGTTNANGLISGVVTYKYRGNDPLPDDSYVIKDSLAFNNFHITVNKSTDNTAAFYTVTATSAQDTLTLTNTVGDGQWDNGEIGDCDTPPSVPVPYSPANGSEVGTRPTICVSNSNHGSCSYAVTYDFQISTNSSMTGIVAEKYNISEGTGVTCYAPSINLNSGQTYYWRARASNGISTSNWSSIRSMTVQVILNNAPGAPTLYSPVNLSYVSSQTPVLTVINAYDPDGDELYYDFQVSGNSAFSSIVSSVSNLPEGSSSTSWIVANSLNQGSSYYWRVRAFDGEYYSTWSNTRVFSVIQSQSNSPPTTPEPESPSNGSTINTLNPTLIFKNSYDANGDRLTYQIQVATSNSFNTIVATASNVSAGSGTYTYWLVNHSLSENEDFWWRVRAYDGTAASSFCDPVQFFVDIDGLNTHPVAPNVLGPEDDAYFENTAPVLTVINSESDLGTPLTYIFEVWTADRVSRLRLSPQIIEGADGLTYWMVDPFLNRGQRYYWRCHTFDGVTYGYWTDWRAFTIADPNGNTAPEPPLLCLPANGDSLYGQSHPLQVYQVIDPDGDDVHYEFRLSSTSNMAQIIEQNMDVGIKTDSISTYFTTGDLINNHAYYWQARSYDGFDYSEWSEKRYFRHFEIVSSTFEVPTVDSPQDAAEIPQIRPVFSLLTDETDVGNPFYIQISDNKEFNDPMVSKPITGTLHKTLWTPDFDLEPNKVYYWKARATESDWSEVRSFTVTAQIHVTPNPYRPNKNSGNIVFKNIPSGSDLKILSVSGDVVREFEKVEGPDVVWDAANSQGNKIASGVYLYYIFTQSDTYSGKLAVIR